MNPISSYLAGFSQKLKSGEFYKAPLSPQERQGHLIVSMVIEKAMTNADIMGALAAEFLNKAVALESQINAKLQELNKEIEQQLNQEQQCENRGD